jgi:hypothetical protein
MLEGALRQVHVTVFTTLAFIHHFDHDGAQGSCHLDTAVARDFCDLGKGERTDHIRVLKWRSAGSVTSIGQVECTVAGKLTFMQMLDGTLGIDCHARSKQVKRCFRNHLNVKWGRMVLLVLMRMNLEFRNDQVFNTL